MAAKWKRKVEIIKKTKIETKNGISLIEANRNGVITKVRIISQNG